MLSERVRSLQLSPLQEFFRKARAMEQQGEDVISLAVGELNFPVPEHIKTAGIKAIERGESKYTAAGGIMELREVAAADFWGTGITAAKADNTVVSAGSQPLIAAAMLALCDKGDKILVPAPYYPPYVTLASVFGIKPVVVDTNPDGFMLTTKGVEKIIKRCFFRRPRVIVLNSPNNPTGMVWDINELLGLQELGLYFIADEAYHRIIYGKRYASLASFPGIAERTITIRSCSKTYAMSGWRIGYLTGPQEIVDKIELYLEASMVSACAISQRAAIAALKGLPEESGTIKEMVRELGIRKNFLLAWLDRHDFYCPAPQGAFYVFPNLPGQLRMSSTALAKFLLEKAKVVVTPGMAFGGELYDGYIRMSYASVKSMEQLQQGLERIEKSLKL